MICNFKVLILKWKMYNKLRNFLNLLLLKISFTLLLISSLSFVYSGNPFYTKLNFPIVDSLKTNNDLSGIKLIFVGDLMCHSPQFNNAFVDSLSIYDFNVSFSLVKDIIKNGDLAFGNFETVLAGVEKKFSGYPLFNSPDEFLFAIKNAGFNVLNLANNHILDRGYAGLVRTSEMIDSLNILRLGAFTSQEDRDSVRLFEKGEFKIAILSYSYSTNGNKIKNLYSVNIISDSLLKKDISMAKNKNANLIVVYFHFGEEYQRNYNKFQKKIIDSAFKSGADIIVCSHPHVVQSFSKIIFDSTNNPNKSGQVIDTGFVSYSLGNFISNQDGVYKQEGAILELNITRTLDKNFLENVQIYLTYCFKGIYNSRKKHIVIPVNLFGTDSLKQMGFKLSVSDIEKIDQIKKDTIFKIK